MPDIFNNTLTLSTITFNKYHGTGNDFIIIDNRKQVFNPADTAIIRAMCDRRTGIGADGLILIGRSDDHDFEMKYFNSDGLESTMCGNGGRCAADYAIRAGIAGKKLVFRAIDGLHQAEAEGGIIRLQMNDVSNARLIRDNYFINTGSPHYILFRNNVMTIDVGTEGKEIRWADYLPPGGANVNFAEVNGNKLFVRTYERGVEGETLSCGTGATASAIAAALSGQIVSMPVEVQTKGGELNVSFRIKENKITDIRLSGPATPVFKGVIDI